MSTRMQGFLLYLCLAFVVGGCNADGFLVEPDIAIEDQIQQRVTASSISPTTGFAENSATTWSISGDTVSFRGAWIVPISLTVGQPVPTITAQITDTALTCSLCADSSAVIVQLISTSGGASTTLAEVTSNSSGVTQTMTIITSHVVTSTETLKVRFLTFSVFPDPANRLDSIEAMTVDSQGITSITTGVDLADCLIVSGSVASQAAPIGIVIPAFTTYRFKLRIPPRSNEIISGLSALFISTASASNVSSVTLRYVDSGSPLSIFTVTGISFTQNGQSWVMSGVPSIPLDGRVGRVYFLQVSTSGAGSANWYAVETVTSLTS